MIFSLDLPQSDMVEVGKQGNEDRKDARTVKNIKSQAPITAVTRFGSGDRDHRMKCLSEPNYK